MDLTPSSPYSAPAQSPASTASTRQSPVSKASRPIMSVTHLGMVLHPITTTMVQPPIELDHVPDLRLDEIVEHADQDRIFGRRPGLYITKRQSRGDRQLETPGEGEMRGDVPSCWTSSPSSDPFLAWFSSRARASRHPRSWVLGCGGKTRMWGTKRARVWAWWWCG